MQQIELSIIIPVYNAEKYIGRCIQSILDSTEDRFEVIAINDGSKDASLQICQELASRDPRLQVYSKQNGGVSSARNVGLDKATGRYITFCDADDYYEEGAITQLINTITSSDYDLLFFQFYLRPQNSPQKLYTAPGLIQTQQVKVTYIKDNFWDLLNNGMINSSWNRVFERKRIEKLQLRFRTDMTISEDGLFNVKYLRDLDETSKILYIATPFYNYMSNDGQATRKKVVHYFYMMNLAFDNIDGFIGQERKTKIYWKEWGRVIKETFYHQNYIVDNADEILSNKHTKEMLERYRSQSLEDRFFMRNLKSGRIGTLCVFYKTAIQTKKRLNQLLKGKTR